MPSPESYRRWVDKRRDKPETKALAYAALDAYERIKNREFITLEDIEPIATAARCKYLCAWDIGTGFLVLLAKKHPAAQDAIRAIINSPKANERWQILAALQLDLPKSFCLEIIQKALKDKSKHVRSFAVSACDRLDLSELLPQLDNLFEVETDPSHKAGIKSIISMMRNGYEIQDGESSSFIWVRAPGGGRIARSISQADIDSGQVQVIVEELLEQYRILHG